MYLYEREPRLQALLAERLSALQELVGAYSSQGNPDAADAVGAQAMLGFHQLALSPQGVCLPSGVLFSSR